MTKEESEDVIETFIKKANRGERVDDSKGAGIINQYPRELTLYSEADSLLSSLSVYKYNNTEKLAIHLIILQKGNFVTMDYRITMWLLTQIE